MAGRNGARHRGADGQLSAGDGWAAAARAGETFTGTDGIDIYNGTRFADTVTLRGGGDIAHGNAGNDDIDGGVGDDILAGDDGNDRLSGGDGLDILDGGAGNDIIMGGDRADRITTGTGRDSVDAGAGNDIVTADDFAAGDRLDGGAGKDVLYLTVTGRRAVSADLTGDGNGEVSVNGKQATISNFETFVFHLGSGDDQVVFDFYNGAVALNGMAGDDRLVGGSARDALTGGDGNDSLFGQVGDDAMDGGEGNDRLFGGAGDDTMDGGAGNDTYIVDSAKDVIRDVSGIDEVETSISYTLGTGLENAILNSTEDVSLTGNDLKNILIGYDGANAIAGGKGADRLDGGAGDDRLDGGDGHDVLTGGDGADRFVLVSTGAADTIIDFTHGVDTILLAGSALGIPAGPLADGAFRFGAVAQEADDRILYDLNSGSLYVDRDGSGTHFKAVLIATLGTELPLSASDFLVI